MIEKCKRRQCLLSFRFTRYPWAILANEPSAHSIYRAHDPCALLLNIHPDQLWVALHSIMTELYTLPDEVLLICVAGLPQANLPSLTLVATRFRPLVEDVLYQFPILERHWGKPGQYHKPMARLRSFARTLLGRLVLAHKVRGLTMVTAKHDYDSNPYTQSTCDRMAVQVLEYIGQKSTQWRSRIGDWQTRLEQGDGNAWGGLFFALVSHLKYLDIEILSRAGLWHQNLWDSARYAIHPIEKLFSFIADRNDAEAFLPVDLSMIAGLNSLERLRFFGFELETNWCLLPNLRSLEVNRECFLPDNINFTSSSARLVCRDMSDLTMELSTYSMIYDIPIVTGNTETRFISSVTLPSLRTLDVKLSDIEFRGYDEYWDDQVRSGMTGNILAGHGLGRLDMLLDQIKGLSITLFHLSIDTYYDLEPFFSCYIVPTISMARLQNLQHWTLPQELLIGIFYGTALQNYEPLPPQQLLPSSLKNPGRHISIHTCLRLA